MLLARSDRARCLVAAGMVSFHLATFAGTTIIFLPHLVAIAAFLPLERGWAYVVSRRRWPESAVGSFLGRQRAGRSATGQPPPIVRNQPVDQGGGQGDRRREHQPTDQ